MTLLASVVAVAAVLAMLPGRVAGVCPSNGDTHVLYVTANGDRGFHDILMLDTFGRPVGTAINWTSVPETSNLLKLRGMAVGPDGTLFVAIALGVHSKIIAFSSVINTDCTRNFERVVSHVGPDNKYLQHPYSVVVMPFLRPTAGARGNKTNPTYTLLSTNQNSASVTWVNAADGTLQPSPLSNGTDGLFAVDYSLLHQRADPLRIESKAKTMYSLTSVRGAATTPDGKLILVADVDADAVLVFDVKTGHHLWSITIPTPIQIVFCPPGFLNMDGTKPAADAVPHALVTSKTSQVFVLRVERPEADVGIVMGSNAVRNPLVSVFADGFLATSGVAIDSTGGFAYVADRVNREIRRLRFDGADLGPFGPALRDQPEHLLIVQVADPRTFPHCHELGPMGLKYSVLCIAGYGWLTAFIIGGALLLTGTVKVVF